MPYPWFRLYSNIVYSPKMRCLTMTQRWLWVGLLALANESPTRGALEVAPGRPYTVGDLAAALGATPKQIGGALDLFRALSMVHARETAAGPLIVISNWEKHQYEPSSLRVQKHRRAAAQNGAAEAAEEEEPGRPVEEGQDPSEGEAAGEDDPPPDEATAGAAPHATAQPAPSAPARFAGRSMKQAPETLSKRGDDAAQDAGADPDTEPEIDAEAEANDPSAEREGMILPSLPLSLSPSQEEPDEGAAGAPRSQEGGDGQEEPVEEQEPLQGEEPETLGWSGPTHHKSWRIEEKIGECADKWAPGDDPERYVHQVFKLWRKTRLDEGHMFRAVKKAIDVTQLRMEKKLIHTGSYMGYLMTVLQREVLPEAKKEPPDQY